MDNLELLTPELNDPIREQIRNLSERLDGEYLEMGDERRLLATWEEDQEFTILGVVELYTAYVQGYAAQVLANYYPDQPQTPIEHLRQLILLEVPYVAAWYFTSPGSYPKLKQSVETLDHLRLVLIEYLSHHLSA